MPLSKDTSSNNRKAAIAINGTITMESAHINGEAQMRQGVFQRGRIVVVALLHLVDQCGHHRTRHRRCFKLVAARTDGLVISLQI